MPPWPCSRPTPRPWFVAGVAAGAVSIEDFEGTPNPDVVELAKRITWEPWADSGYPDRFPAEIEVTLRDGSSETITVADVNGNRTRPWGTEQVVGKFKKTLRWPGCRSKVATAFSKPSERQRTQISAS